MKITVANKTFKTKRELECFTRDFLTKNDGKTIVMGQYGSKFLSDLVDRHPERERKIKGDIESFTIGRNFGGHIALSLTDKEGLKSIGWEKCVNQNKETYLKYLNEVCRREIHPFVQAYKDDNYYDGMTCPSCLKTIPNRKSAHVDHKTTPFRDILNSFVGLHWKNLPKEFTSAGNHLGYIFKDEDFFIKEAWISHHNELADYQILCGDCNVAKK